MHEERPGTAHSDGHTQGRRNHEIKHRYHAGCYTTSQNLVCYINPLCQVSTHTNRTQRCQCILLHIEVVQQKVGVATRRLTPVPWTRMPSPEIIKARACKGGSKSLGKTSSTPGLVPRSQEDSELPRHCLRCRSSSPVSASYSRIIRSGAGATMLTNR